MRVLLRLWASISVTTAALMLRGVEVSDRLTKTSSVATKSDTVVAHTNAERSTYGSHKPSSLRARHENDVIEIYLQKDFKGQYYHYTAEETDNYVCHNVVRLVGEHFVSVRQKRPEGRSHVRCHYYAEDECGVSRGKLTKLDIWEQGDLSREPRKSGNDVIGNWYDEIGSVQCFWVRGAEFGEQGAEKAGLKTSDGPALVNETSNAKALKLRNPTTHDNDRLSEIYADADYRGKPVAWVTQQSAEREYCIKVDYPKGTTIRSIKQHKDSEDVWFVCWYYDDDHCNSSFNQNQVFPAFYLQRDESKDNFAKAVKSVRCNYADPGGWSSRRSVLLG